MSNDVVVPGNLPVHMGPLEGFESIQDRRILGNTYPELRILHAVRSQADRGGTPGNYRLGKTFMETVRCVFVKAHKIRVLAEGPTREKQTTVCGSMNGIKPLDDLLYPRGKVCDICDYAQWTDGPNDKRIPPPCKEGLALFGLLPDENDAPFWFICKGMGSYKGAVEYCRALRGCRGIRSMAQAVVQLTTGEQKNNGVIWYDPIFTIEDQLFPYDKYQEITKIAARDVWYTPFVRQTEAPDATDDAIVVPGQQDAASFDPNAL